MTLLEKVVQNVSRKTGLTPEEIKNKSPEDIRVHLTKRTGKPFTVTSAFPFIGRGNVLRDGIVSTAQLNKIVDSITQGA